MDIKKLLTAAGVPADLHDQAVASIEAGRTASRGLLLRKFYVRWFRAGKIASLLAWEDERLLDKHPELAAQDIAPAWPITCNGDNIPWAQTPEGGRPQAGAWLNKDPQSDEYKAAVAACYWCPGHHPRSPEARAAWYARNACEYEAWEKGAAVTSLADVQSWDAPGISVVRCGSVWQITALQKLLGPLKMSIDIGYEVGNVFGVVSGQRVQCWYPIKDHELRATVVRAVYPVFSNAAAV